MASTKTNSKLFDSVVGPYRIPLFIIVLGVVVSISSFISAINREFQDFRSNFALHSQSKAFSLENRFSLVSERLGSVGSLFAASDFVSADEFKVFVEPFFYKGPLRYVGWFPNSSAHTEVYGVWKSNFDRSFSSGTSLRLKARVNAAVQQVFSTRTLTLLDPITLKNSAGYEGSYSAIAVPVVNNQDIVGVVAGVIDLDALVTMILQRSVAFKDANVFLFNGASSLIFKKGELPPFLEADPSDNTITLEKFLHYQGISSQDLVSLANQSWIIVCTPATHASLVPGLLPWMIFAFSCIITLLIGRLILQQTKQNILVERKVEEQVSALLAASRTVSEKEKRLRAIIDYSTDGLITVDHRGLIIDFNPACERLFQYKADEVIGKNVSLLNISPADSQSAGLTREIECKRKDGTTFAADFSVSEIVLDDRHMFSGIIRDITERKLAEEDREKLITSLSATNEELEQFAYVASHDLQEPLRMVTNFTALIGSRYGDKLDEKGKEFIKISVESAARMQEMVSDLLVYARITEENDRFTEVDCTAELMHVLENLRDVIEERQAQITYDKLPSIPGNPIRFMRLMQNLISNGLKYQEKGATPAIHVGVRDRGEKWLFSVQDNGIGIKEEYFKRIFYPFKRLHTRKEYSGTGVGLAICKKIVEAQGGEIWLESSPGKGSIFYFTALKS